MKEVLTFGKKIVVIVALILPLCNCNNETGKPLSLDSYVYKPFDGIDVPANTYDVNPSETATLETESGTSIVIPANSLVDVNNVPVKGKVKVTYQEYQTPADIIVSGIPMKYDSGGTKYDFVSAGMFNITATTASSSEPVYIGKDKKIQITMASYKDGDNYSFYRLDTVNKNWTRLGIDVAKENTDKKAELKELTEKYIEPVKPVKCMSSDLVLDFDVDYSSFPELRAFSGILWKYAGTTVKDNPENNEWVFNTKWSNISLTTCSKESMTYFLSLKNYATSYTAVVQPVFSEKDYAIAQATFEKQKDEYDKIIIDKEKEFDRVEKEADLVRSFAVSQFGVYNWDRCLDRKQAVYLNAEFIFDDKVNQDISQIKVFLVTGSDKAVVGYSPADYNKFSFLPGTDNKLLAVLPGNKIAVFSSADFKAIDVASLKEQEKPTYKFRMKTLSTEISNSDDLNKLIETI